MANSTISTGLDIMNRYHQATTGSSGTTFDPYINRAEAKEAYDKLYEDKSTLDFTDMLSLMIAQFQNQTIDNQADTSDMMNQLVQMSSMQAMTEMTTQMGELTTANILSYSASLVGKIVTVGVYDDKGKLNEICGEVEAAGTYDGQQVIFIKGKSYYLSSIMAIGELPKPTTPVDPDNKDEVTDPDNKDEVTDPDSKDETTDTDNKTDTDNTTGSGSDSSDSGDTTTGGEVG